MSDKAGGPPEDTGKEETLNPKNKNSTGADLGQPNEDLVSTSQVFEYIEHPTVENTLHTTTQQEAASRTTQVLHSSSFVNLAKDMSQSDGDDSPFVFDEEQHSFENVPPVEQRNEQNHSNILEKQEEFELNFFEKDFADNSSSDLKNFNVQSAKQSEINFPDLSSLQNQMVEDKNHQAPDQAQNIQTERQDNEARLSFSLVDMRYGKKQQKKSSIDQENTTFAPLYNNFDDNLEKLDDFIRHSQVEKQNTVVFGNNLNANQAQAQVTTDFSMASTTIDVTKKQQQQKIADQAAIQNKLHHAIDEVMTRKSAVEADRQGRKSSFMTDRHERKAELDSNQFNSNQTKNPPNSLNTPRTLKPSLIKYQDDQIDKMQLNKGKTPKIDNLDLENCQKPQNQLNDKNNDKNSHNTNQPQNYQQLHLSSDDFIDCNSKILDKEEMTCHKYYFNEDSSKLEPTEQNVSDKTRTEHLNFQHHIERPQEPKPQIVWEQQSRRELLAQNDNFPRRIYPADSDRQYLSLGAQPYARPVMYAAIRPQQPSVHYSRGDYSVADYEAPDERYYRMDQVHEAYPLNMHNGAYFGQQSNNNLFCKSILVLIIFLLLVISFELGFGLMQHEKDMDQQKGKQSTVPNISDMPNTYYNSSVTQSKGYMDPNIRDQIYPKRVITDPNIHEEVQPKKSITVTTIPKVIEPWVKSTDPNIHEEIQPKKAITDTNIPKVLEPWKKTTDPNIHEEVQPKKTITETNIPKEPKPWLKTTDPNIHEEIEPKKTITDTNIPKEIEPWKQSTDPNIHEENKPKLVTISKKDADEIFKKVTSYNISKPTYPHISIDPIHKMQPNSPSPVDEYQKKLDEIQKRINSYNISKSYNPHVSIDPINRYQPNSPSYSPSYRDIIQPKYIHRPNSPYIHHEPIKIDTPQYQQPTYSDINRPKYKSQPTSPQTTHEPSKKVTPHYQPMYSDIYDPKFTHQNNSEVSYHQKKQHQSEPKTEKEPSSDTYNWLKHKLEEQQHQAQDSLQWVKQQANTATEKAKDNIVSVETTIEQSVENKKREAQDTINDWITSVNNSIEEQKHQAERALSKASKSVVHSVNQTQQEAKDIVHSVEQKANDTEKRVTDIAQNTYKSTNQKVDEITHDADDQINKFQNKTSQTIDETKKWFLDSPYIEYKPKSQKKKSEPKIVVKTTKQEPEIIKSKSDPQTDELIKQQMKKIKQLEKQIEHEIQKDKKVKHKFEALQKKTMAKEKAYHSKEDQKIESLKNKIKKLKENQQNDYNQYKVKQQAKMQMMKNQYHQEMQKLKEQKKLLEQSIKIQDKKLKNEQQKYNKKIKDEVDDFKKFEKQKDQEDQEKTWNYIQKQAQEEKDQLKQMKEDNEKMIKKMDKKFKVMQKQQKDELNQEIQIEEQKNEELEKENEKLKKQMKAVSKRMTTMKAQLKDAMEKSQKDVSANDAEKGASEEHKGEEVVQKKSQPAKAVKQKQKPVLCASGEGSSCMCQDGIVYYGERYGTTHELSFEEMIQHPYKVRDMRNGGIMTMCSFMQFADAGTEWRSYHKVRTDKQCFCLKAQPNGIYVIS